MIELPFMTIGKSAVVAHEMCAYDRGVTIWA